jgi:hypothetical protein
MRHTAAFDRFLQSMKLDYEKWREGEGYDLTAIPEMTPAERDEIVELLAGDGHAREVTWREVDALARIDSGYARACVDEALRHHLRIDTRLAAAQAMHAQGRLPEIDTFLAAQIRNLHDDADGLTRALLMAEQHPTDAVKQALLWASWNQTKCSMHCAALLCMLCGVTKDPFDWNLRPFFIRLDLHNSYFERKAAFDELCALVNMRLEV